MPKKTKKNASKKKVARPKGLRRNKILNIRTKRSTSKGPRNDPMIAGVSSIAMNNPARPMVAMSGRSHPRYGLSSRFVGCDLFTNVTVPAAADNVVGTILANAFIAPVQFVGTRLAQFAPLWERFKYNAITFHFIPAEGTTVTGQVAAFCDYDPTDDLAAVTAAQRPQRVAAAMGSSAAQLWQSMSTSLAYVDNMQNWETDDEAVDPASLRLQNQGQYWLILQLPTNAAAGSALGSVYVEYDIEFFIPQLDDSASLFEAKSYNLIKNAPSYGSLSYESESAWYGLVGAQNDAISGQVLDPNRDQSLAPNVYTSYAGPSSQYVTITVADYVGSLRWTGYASTNDGVNVLLGVTYGSRQIQVGLNPIVVAVGHLDQTAGGINFGAPWVPGTRDYPQAIGDTTDQAISGTLAVGQTFTPTCDWDVLNVATGNTSNQMAFSFVTVSEGGVTTIQFLRDVGTEGALYWKSVYLSIDTVAPPSGLVNPVNQPTFMLTAQARKRAKCPLKYGHHRSFAVHDPIPYECGDIDEETCPREKPIVLRDLQQEIKMAKAPVDTRDVGDDSNPIVIVSVKEAEEFARWKLSNRRTSASTEGNTATLKIL